MKFAVSGLLKTLAVLIALLLIVGPGVLAQAPAAPEAAASAPAAPTAAAGVPIRFENRTLFTFRANVGPFGPADRATAASERLRAIAAAGGPLQVSVEARPDGNLMLVDGKPAFMVLPGDASTLLGETFEGISRHAELELVSAARAYRDQRSVTFVLKAVAIAAAETLVFGLLIWGLVRVRRWVKAHIADAVERAMRRMQRDLTSALSPEALGGVAEVLLTIGTWGLGLFASYVWLTSVLTGFPYTQPWGVQLAGFLFDTVGDVARAVVGALPGLFVVAIIVMLTRAVARIGAAFFDRIESGSISVGVVDRFTAPMTRRLVTTGLWLFALAMAYPYLPGAETDAFKGLSVLLGLMVSIGASSVVGQAASGLILTYSHSLKPGEYLRIGDSEGTLQNIGMFSTRILTGLGELVVLPNSLVLATTTTNYSRAHPGTGFVMDTEVTIGYSTPWRQVQAMLIEAARRTEGVAATPPPRVAQTSLSDFYITYRLICWALPQQPRVRAALLSELHAAIVDVFNENGVQIMSPHYMADPPAPQVVPQDQWAPPLARATDPAASRG
jgi:small-conductance mechanosensitive channel